MTRVSFFWIKIKFLFHEMKVTWKTAGLKGLYRKYGLKLFAMFFVYYLVRDVTIYLVIPWMIAKKALN